MIRSDKKGEKVMEYQELLSVGCLITKDLKVFPINCNEPPETASEADEYNGVHLYDVDGEWFNNLDADDLTNLFAFIEKTQDLTMVVYQAWKDGIWGDWETANNCYLNMEVI
jgi:hypothetical protein|tara:strand:+ start:38 stop:373 length:336 start_codon:yes stop_codon:yes gene_type:complete